MAIDRVARTISFSILISFFWSLVGVQALHLAAPPQEAQQTRSQGDAFAMVDGIPEHRIGRNDLLHITVWNGLNVEDTTVRVAEDGTIFVPFGVDLNLKVRRIVFNRSQAPHSEGIVEILSRDSRSGGD